MRRGRWMPSENRQYLAFILAFISGGAALSHQILWTRRLVDILGANADTFSKVIGAFFVGLALGAFLAAKEFGIRNPWHRVAASELLVALLAVPSLVAANWADWIYLQPLPSSLLKLILPFILVLPPATAMGLVIPWLMNALKAEPGGKWHSPAILYGFNTLGGLCGLGVVMLVALPKFGLAGASIMAIFFNLLVAVGSWLTGSNALEVAYIRQVEAAPAPPGEKFLAFFSGFLVLAVEVVLQHQLAQVSINSLFSSAIVLALVLFSLGVASFLTPITGGLGSRRLSWILLAAGGLCMTEPLLLSHARNGLTILPYELPPGAYTWEIIKLGGLSICPMLVIAGLVFPMLLNRAGIPADSEGPTINVFALFAWNGLGGWLGAEVGQLWMIPRLGLWLSVVTIGAVYGVLAIGLLYSKPSEKAQRWRIAPHFVVLSFLILVCTRTAKQLPQAFVRPEERLAAIGAGPEGVVAALECGPGDWRLLFNNSYTLGGSKASFNQERQALLPLLLHGSAKRVATLGVATGSTVAGAALSPRVGRIDAIELSPLVLNYAERFFGPYNRQVFKDPRVHFIQEDARWVVARERGVYDVIAGDLFLPWRTGEGRLFTLEHFRNVRRALAPGGLYCQWLPLFQLTRPQFETIARTFLEIFPEAFLVRGDFYAELPIVGLVGGRDLTALNWAQIADGCAALRAQGKVFDPLLRHVEGVAMCVAGPVPKLPPGPINTLANGWIEWDAARNILGMGTPWFIAVPYAEFIRDVQRAGQPLVPAEMRPMQDAGQFFLTLEIAAKMKLPFLDQLRGQIGQRLPQALQEDAGAEWQHWPMQFKITPQRN